MSATPSEKKSSRLWVSWRWSLAGFPTAQEIFTRLQTFHWTNCRRGSSAMKPLPGHCKCAHRPNWCGSPENGALNRRILSICEKIERHSPSSRSLRRRRRGALPPGRKGRSPNLTKQRMETVRPRAGGERGQGSGTGVAVSVRTVAAAPGSPTETRRGGKEGLAAARRQSRPSRCDWFHTLFPVHRPAAHSLRRDRWRRTTGTDGDVAASE